MKALLLIGLLAIVKAEIGKECSLNSECEGDEICIMLPKFGEMELPKKGKCHPKMKEYELCLLDTHCESGMKCTKSPLLETPLPVIGICSMCSSNADCSNNEYCDHPVLNSGCMETMLYYEKIQKQKMQAEMAAHAMMKHAMMGKGEGPDEMSQGGPMNRNTQYPQFPVMQGAPPAQRRNKRGVGSWMVNGPSLRCMPKKAVNAHCRRSLECSSGTCSIEGACK